MISPETEKDVLAEIAYAIDRLTTEVKLHRLQMKAITDTLQDVVDEGANENFPGYIRVKQIAG